MSDSIARRARHVVTEIARVHEMVAILQRGDAVQAGALLWATQDSLRDDYEVSCGEVDDLINLLRQTPGVHGARMVGGGFGGVLLALVASDAVDAVRARVEAENYAERGVREQIEIIAPSDGARVQPQR